MICIEKGIPFPGKPRKPHPLDEAPWKDLEIGDSFTFIHGTSAGVHKRAKAAGIQIAVKCITDNAPYTYRVWRTK